jgi:hypothetical protein
VRVLSLGAGVQSTALLVLSNLGKIDRASVAVFADTQDEPDYVYRHLEWARGWSKIPIEVVTAGKLSDRWENEGAFIPAYIENGGMLNRVCTERYKIRPIQKYLKGKTVELMIGISVDEAHRMKPNSRKSITNRWPLIELRMNRQDCINYIRDEGLPVPFKSSCVYCPFHRDSYWLWLKQNHPKDFDRAVIFDEKIRNNKATNNRLFLHNQRVPLPMADLNERQVEMFGDFHKECTGYCGV